MSEQASHSKCSCKWADQYIVSSFSLSGVLVTFMEVSGSPWTLLKRFENIFSSLENTFTDSHQTKDTYIYIHNYTHCSFSPINPLICPLSVFFLKFKLFQKHQILFYWNLQKIWYIVINVSVWNIFQNFLNLSGAAPNIRYPSNKLHPLR